MGKKLPKYCKHNRRDKAYVWDKGKQVYLPGKYGSDESKSAYWAFVANRNAADATRDIAPEHIGSTVAWLAAEFLQHAETHYPDGENSEYWNCHYALQHLVRYHGRDRLEEFGPRKFGAFLLALADEGKARTYINQCRNKIVRAWKWAVSQEYISPNVHIALSTVPGLRKGAARETKPRQPVSWADIWPVTGALRATLRDALLLQYWTGVRSGSLVIAAPNQFEKTCDGWLWWPQHKQEHTGHTVVIPLGPRATKVVEPLLGGEGLLFQPVQRKHPRYRGFYTSRTYRNAIYRGQDKAGVERWQPHQMRHSRSTDITEKFGLSAAQAYLGHASHRTTERYTHQSLALARRVAEEMG